MPINAEDCNQRQIIHLALGPRPRSYQLTGFFALLLMATTATPRAAGAGGPTTTLQNTHSPSGKDRRAKLGIMAGLKAGVALHQAFSPLGAGPAVELEAGYLLPFLGRRLGILLSLSYAQANASDQANDPRLPGGSYNWALTQQQLMLSVGLTARIFPPFGKLGNGYLNVGPRVYFLKTLQEQVDASGVPFGKWNETETRVGAFVTLGGEFYLGPGALFVEFEHRYNQFTATLTGDADGSALRVALGYRLLL